MYENGEGVEEDYASAIEWYQLAADQEYAAAQFNLGLMYEEGGEGVDQNHPEAIRLFKLAAAQGLTQAKDYLAALLQQHPELAQ